MDAGDADVCVCVGAGTAMDAGDADIMCVLVAGTAVDAGDAVAETGGEAEEERARQSPGLRVLRADPLRDAAGGHPLSPLHAA